MTEPTSVLQEIHSPVCPTCGAVLCSAHGHEFPTESDVPIDLRRELMRASVAKGINYYWLCAIYRQGLIDQRQRKA